MIKTEKQLKGPAACSLEGEPLPTQADANGNLCKVCVPSSRDLEAKVGKLVLRDDESLDPMYDMTDIWSDPPRKHLHIVARYDPADGKCNSSAVLSLYTIY